MNSPDDRLEAIVTLPTSDEAIKFMRAAVDIEASLENTRVKIVNVSECAPGCACGEGDAPKANESPEAGHWQMVGVITGPEAGDIPENERDAVLANWTGEVIGILESYGLIEERSAYGPH